MRVAALVLFLCAAAPARAEDSPWAEQKAPSGGASRAIGGYSAGCLAGGVELPLKGRGWEVMRPDRKRHFAHRQMIEFMHGVRDEAETRSLIVRENRHYARRQLIWFRKEPNLNWLQTSGEQPETLAAVEAMLAARDS